MSRLTFDQFLTLVALVMALIALLVAMGGGR